jgi:alpha-galactosidase
MGRAFLNGTVYVNDPDVVFFRSVNCSLSETEKECIALVNFLFAGQIMCSDNFLSLNEADLFFTERIHELYGKLDGDEYGPVGIAKDVYLLESRLGTITGLINLSNKPFFLEGDLSGFTGGTWLVDQRLEPERKDRLGFVPRSISIYQKS